MRVRAAEGVLSIVLLLVTVLFGYEFSRETISAVQMEEIDRSSRALLVSLLDAETGQRGYIITGNPSYLVPYQAGTSVVNQRVAELQVAVGHTVIAEAARQVGVVVDLKLKELAYTIDVRRQHGMNAAQKEVDTHLGKNYMDMLRSDIDQLLQIMAMDQESQTRARANLFARLAFVSMLGSLGACFAYGRK